MSIKQLGEQTPITAALAITLCYVCYWIGSETSAMRVRLDAAEQTQQRLTEVVERLSGITAGNTQRLDRLERSP